MELPLPSVPWALYGTVEWDCHVLHLGFKGGLLRSRAITQAGTWPKRHAMPRRGRVLVVAAYSGRVRVVGRYTDVTGKIIKKLDGMVTAPLNDWQGTLRFCTHGVKIIHRDIVHS